MSEFLDGLERTKIIRIGEKEKPVFSKEEMTNRNTKLRNYMGEKDIDAVLFTSYHNVNYYSGYLYTSFGRHTGLLVTQDKHVTITPQSLMRLKKSVSEFLHSVTTRIRQLKPTAGSVSVRWKVNIYCKQPVPPR